MGERWNNKIWKILTLPFFYSKIDLISDCSTTSGVSKKAHPICKFDRFYILKAPFQNFDSAQKHLALFMLAYLFLIIEQSQPCPLEKIGCNVLEIPFYHLLNKPDVRLLKNRMAA